MYVRQTESSVPQAPSDLSKFNRARRSLPNIRTSIRYFVIITVMVWGSSDLATAGDLSDEPVGVRISLAKDRLLTITDTVARQASAAYPIASSNNPAADDFLRAPPADYQGYGLLLTSDTFFNNGTSVSGFSGIGAVRLEEAGTLTAAYVRFDSHDGTSRQGDHYALRTNEFFLGYSHRLAEYLAIGVEIQVSDSTLNIDDTFLSFPRGTSSDTLGAGFDLGVMMAVHETVLIGVHGGFKWDRTETDGQVDAGGPPIPIDVEDTFRTSEFRCGIGWQPTPQVGVFADWQYVSVDSDSGTTEVGRVYLGTEIYPIETLAMQLGTVVDTQPQLGVSAGLAYYGIKGVPIKLAYAFNTLPEVRREFGRSHVLSATVVILF